MIRPPQRSPSPAASDSSDESLLNPLADAHDEDVEPPPLARPVPPLADQISHDDAGPSTINGWDEAHGHGEPTPESPEPTLNDRVGAKEDELEYHPEPPEPIEVVAWEDYLEYREESPGPLEDNGWRPYESDSESVQPERFQTAPGSPQHAAALEPESRDSPSNPDVLDFNSELASGSALSDLPAKIDVDGHSPVSKPEDDEPEGEAPLVGEEGFEEESEEEEPTEDTRGRQPLKPGEDYETVTLTPRCLPQVKTKIDNYWAYLFFRFCAERHKMYERRQAGVPRDKLTTDETMTSIHIGNVYRQLDPSSFLMQKDIIGIGDQSVEEVCFRVFLYCMFYNIETWQALCKAAVGGIPTWQNFEEDMPVYEAVLHDISVVQKKKIYYGGFQNVPPNVYFSDNRNKGKEIINYASHLRLVLAMMRAGLPARLHRCVYAEDASYILRTVPGVGGFLGLNLVCFLNDSSNFKWYYRDFATCGPGSRMYLQRMFGKVINNDAMEQAGLRWLAENQWRYWARLGVDPPHEWEHAGLRPGMRVLDFENALCWAHRYVVASERKTTRSFADHPPPYYDPKITEKSHAPHWCVEERFIESTSRASWDHHDESLDRVESIGDEIYEIDRVVARLGSIDDKDGLFRVRWTGWAPEHDTWERESELREDAEEALEEWLSLERAVWDNIEDIKRNLPFVWPDARLSTREARAERAAKRARESVGGQVSPPASKNAAKRPRPSRRDRSMSGVRGAEEACVGAVGSGRWGDGDRWNV